MFEKFVNDLGMAGVEFERFLFQMADKFSEAYDGGTWEAKTIESEESKFYLALKEEKKDTLNSIGF